MAVKTSLVVTGWGLVTPLGLDAPSTWKSLVSGGRAVRELEGEEWGRLPNARAARVDGFRPPQGSEKRDRSLQLALAAVREAWAQAGLSKMPPERIGTTFSSSKGGVLTFLKAQEVWENGVPPSGDFMGDFFPHSAGTFLKQTLGFCGPALSVSSACSTGIGSIVQAVSLLENGVCDAVLAGSAESSLHPLFYSAFQNMRLLTRHPGGACPFDAERDGFLMGEGSGALVLEREESALARGVEPLVKFSGWALGADGQGYLDIEPRGESIEAVIRRALHKAGIGASDIGYINAHGTGTRVNDHVESQAIQRVFGGASARVSSTKGATGHLLGGAGSVEAVFSAIALTEGELPETRNLERPDPKCEVRHVEKGGMRMEVEHVLSLSYGIGGQLGAVIFSKV